MKLVSLAQKFSDFDKPNDAASDTYYPSLHLDKKQLDALDLDTERGGTEMTMTATVRVAGVSEGRDGSRSMTFDIVEAAFEAKEKKPDAASVLFPNG